MYICEGPAVYISSMNRKTATVRNEIPIFSHFLWWLCVHVAVRWCVYACARVRVRMYECVCVHLQHVLIRDIYDGHDLSSRRLCAVIVP